MRAFVTYVSLIRAKTGTNSRYCRTRKTAQPCRFWLSCAVSLMGVRFILYCQKGHGFPCFFCVLSLMCHLRADLWRCYSDAIMVLVRDVPRKNARSPAPGSYHPGGLFSCGLSRFTKV